MKRRAFLKGATTAAAGAIATAYIRPAAAQSRTATLLTLSESGPNNLDIMGVGTNRPGYEASWNTYDRLLTYGVKKDENGNDHYDYTKFEPELAEFVGSRRHVGDLQIAQRCDFSRRHPDHRSRREMVVRPRRNRRRLPTFQFKAGSLEKRDQFVVVDDHTFRVDFLRKDRLTFPDLAVPTPIVINSGLARKHATDKDPWAMEWLKNAEAGGGAFQLEKWTPGQEIIFRRFEGWKSGPLPKIERVIWRTVPSAGTRRALHGARRCRYLGRSAAQRCLRDGEREQAAHRRDAYRERDPVPRHERKDEAVRQRQGAPGGCLRDPISKDHGRGDVWPRKADVRWPERSHRGGWPQPSPYVADLAKAKRLLAEAGLPNGFETTLSFDLGAAVINEPICELVQESLGQIGVKVILNKIPGANWRAEFSKKTLPFSANVFGGWLNYPEYFFFWNYHGQNSIFNTMSYQNPAMDKLIDAARFETDPKKYKEEILGFIQLAFTEIPRIPLFQPYLDVAMQKNVTGYRYWFHRQLDYRQLAKT